MMYESVKIRDYRESDFKEIVKIWEKVGMWRPERADSEEVIKATLRNGGFLIVVEINEKIIGTSWVSNDGRRAYLHHFAISPEYQGKGLSKPLLDETLKRVKNLGLQLKLEVHKDNIIAKALYEKYGFKKLEGYEVYIIRDIQKY